MCGVVAQQCMEVSVGIRAGYFDEEKISFLFRQLNDDSLVVQPVA